MNSNSGELWNERIGIEYVTNELQHLESNIANEEHVKVNNTTKGIIAHQMKLLK
ncbi:MAG: hypothetical protein M9949_02260 [Candidatus Kapabacteria bacterium]|nr:hypothetical protein [Candidatus Kapabacteria bacterium]